MPTHTANNQLTTYMEGIQENQLRIMTLAGPTHTGPEKGLKKAKTLMKGCACCLTIVQ